MIFFMLEMLVNTQIHTYDPEIIRAVFATQFHYFSIGRRHGVLTPLFGKGIFIADGAEWKHSRALLRPQFAREQISQLGVMNEHIGKGIRYIKRKQAETADYLDCQYIMTNITLDTAAEFLFGEPFDSIEGFDEAVKKGRQPRKNPVLLSGYGFYNSLCAGIDYAAMKFHFGDTYSVKNNKTFKNYKQICTDFVDSFVAPGTGNCRKW